jgi:hypothetical protein
MLQLISADSHVAVSRAFTDHLTEFAAHASAGTCR